jgi:iron complex outermembrane receptor protein
MLLPGMAAAQQGAAIEEIIVTSRKREESLQEIPVSVTAFTADQIERAGFTDLEDIAMQTTGFQFNTELSGTRPGRLFSNMRFRGIESAGFSATQTASLYIDGVYALQGAQSISLMDLERVEIIKGPQSAQFGRNSFAGAVNYITRVPNLDEFKGKIQAEGATYDSYELQASHEGPISDGKLAYRLTARLYEKGSQFTATDGGVLGEQSTHAVSGQLYGKPNDNWDLRARLFFQKDEDGPAATAFMLGRLNDSCTGKTVTVGGVSRSPRLFVCGTVPSPGQAGAPKVTGNTSLFPANAAFTGANANFLVTRLLNFNQVAGVPKLEGFGLEREMFRASITSDYEFSNGVSMSVIGAYNRNAANDLRDWDMTDAVGNNQWYVTNPQKGTDKSLDARIQSSSDDRLRWLVGGNYYTQKFRTSGNGGVFVTACANFALAATEAGFCSAPGLFPTGLDANDFVKVWSVYGSASYDIVDNLTLDIEGRYLHDRRGDGTGFTKVYKQKLPRVSLNYKANDDINVYANWSRGELPGVINSNIINCQTQTYTVPFIDPRTGRPSQSSECQQYTEALGAGAIAVTNTQRLDAFEVGFKSTLADGRATINVAAYTYKWKNQPFATFVTVFRDDNGDRVPNTNQNFFPVNAAGS